MKTRIELSKAYKKGIKVEKERIKKLIDEIDTCPNQESFIKQFKSKIEG